MLDYDTTGLYGDDLISDDRAPSGDDDRIRRAVDRLFDQFESGDIGFVNTPDTDPGPIAAWAGDRLSEHWESQIVIGIGGSSLGARAVLETARPANRDGLDTYFAENLDPESVDRLFNTLNPENTLVVVITKSGTTIETMSQFWIARQWLRDAVGDEQANDQIVAVTDPEAGALRQMVDDHGWDDFSIPQNVGGRFSVLTPVGLVPLALAGYPIESLLEGAARARDGHNNPEAAASSWGIAAAEHLVLADCGFDQLVMMAYSDRLNALVDWFRQLWAESLGKAFDRDGNRVHTGTTPIKAMGVVDQHSQVQLYREGPNNKHISFLEVQNFEADRRIPSSPSLPEALGHLEGKTLSEVFAAELRGTRGALREAGRPTSTWRFDQISPETVGAFLFSWQMITAIAGELLQINAFDQPGVELGKKIAHGLLGRKDHDQYADYATDRQSSTSSGRTLDVL